MDPFGVDMTRFRMMYLRVAAVMMVLPLLAFVLWFMLRTPDPYGSGPDTVSALEVGMFAVLSAVELPLAVWLRRMVLRGTGDFTGKTWVYGRTRTYTNDDAVVMRITAASVTSMSLMSVPVLLGFVLGFMSESWMPFIPFAAYAVLGWGIMFPRPAQVRAWYARQTGVEPVPSIIH